MTISFTCPYCEKVQEPKIDMSGDMPVGTLVACDCMASRTAWETAHRASMERRKNAQRGSSVRSRSLVNVGRVPKEGKHGR